MKTKSKTEAKRLGLDFGKVISGAIQNGIADTSFLGTTFDEAMKSPATEGAMEAVKVLVEEFSREVWIISKCGPSVQNKTLGWLDHHAFFHQTGLKEENVRFCRARHEKAPICRTLGITHFVDDRLDVLEPMIGVVPNLYLFGEQNGDFSCPTSVLHTMNWEGVVDAIIHNSGPPEGR